MKTIETKLIGKRADIKNGSFYEGHWGFVKYFDGCYYGINGGSIGEEICPVFSRNEFIIRKLNNQKS